MRTAGRILFRAVRGFLADDCPQLAASISYYVLFSLFPLLIFLVALLGLLLRNPALEQQLIEGTLQLIPLTEAAGRREVASAIRGVAGGGGVGASACWALAGRWPRPCR